MPPTWRFTNVYERTKRTRRKYNCRNQADEEAHYQYIKEDLLDDSNTYISSLDKTLTKASESYFYRTRVRSLGMLVSNSLTHSCLVNLIDVTLACEDANSKLVEVVTVADVDDEDRDSNSLLQIWKLRFDHKT